MRSNWLLPRGAAAKGGRGTAEGGGGGGLAGNTSERPLRLASRSDAIHLPRIASLADEEP